MSEYVNDLPGGAGRFVEHARGYRAPLCNGEIIAENDEITAAPCADERTREIVAEAESKRGGAGASPPALR